jgi:cell filamentation protein
MSPYQGPVGTEAECEPGSRRRVLCNKLGLVRKSDMDRAEYLALVKAQAHYYDDIITPSTRITCSLLRRMHRDWLSSIYKWAGEYRSVELAKGDFVWPPSYIVPDNMARFEKEMLAKYTPCKPQELKVVCLSVALVHADFLYIHPFPEGNGRMARWLADIMITQAGYPLPAYRFAGKGSHRVRAEYLEAVRKGYDQRFEALADFFEEAILLRESL